VLHQIKLSDETLADVLRARLVGIRATEGAKSKPESVEEEEKIIKAAMPVWAVLKDEKAKLSRTYTVDEFWRWLALAALDADTAGLRKVRETLEAGKLDDQALRIGAFLSEKDLPPVQAALKIRLTHVH
jgi:hypothetical protein